ncbi:MAG: hypothetical protein FVQ77_00535 [Cytophagales bacterium]|nr:hypothetical protein [Cytophagales bacterium]
MKIQSFNIKLAVGSWQSAVGSRQLAVDNMTIDNDNDNDYDKGWLSSDDSPGCAFGSSDEFAGNKGIWKCSWQLAVVSRQII